MLFTCILLAIEEISQNKNGCDTKGVSISLVYILFDFAMEVMRLKMKFFTDNFSRNIYYCKPC